MIALTVSNVDYDKLCNTLQQKYSDDDFEDKELGALIDKLIHGEDMANEKI